MGKDRKKESLWAVCLRGSMIALVLYVAGVCGTAFCLTKGLLPESSAYLLLSANCLLAVWCASMMVLRKSPFRQGFAALFIALLFCFFQIVLGICIWEGPSLTGEGGLLLLWAVAGGVLSMVLSCRNKRKGKRIRK